MNNGFLNTLISFELLTNSNGEQIVEEIAMNLYKEENSSLFEKENFYKLPMLIRDIILVINLDTELEMQGILGFLENSTGLFLEDTIDTLQRIKAIKDYIVLKDIKKAIEKNNVSILNLRDNINNQELYTITNFRETQDSTYEKMRDEICEIADKLYVYSDDRNIFDYLIKYVENNRVSLITEYKQIL